MSQKTIWFELGSEKSAISHGRGVQNKKKKGFSVGRTFQTTNVKNVDFINGSSYFLSGLDFF